MFPRVVSFNTPDFLKGIFPDQITLNSYGLAIGIGIILAYGIILIRTKKHGLDSDKLSELFLWGFLAAFIGGKLLFFLESPTKYLNNPSLMLENIGNGFVFYGSLIFVIPTIYFWLRKNKIPFWSIMDAFAFGGPVLHSMGRLGCFLAGCCHGRVCNNKLGVVFSDPHSAAKFKNIPLYPTQLFDIGINLIALLIVYLSSKKQTFNGQLFLIYIIIYATGRIINEYFRGDDERGFLLSGLLSYSQLIAIILIGISAFGWYKLSKSSFKQKV